MRIRNMDTQLHKMPLVGHAHNSPGGETVNCNRDRNNGQSTGNVWTDWRVDQSTFRLAGHVDRSHLIVLKMKYIKISMLFSCYSCYQYVGSCCVLWNFDLKSWVKCNQNQLLFTIRALKQKYTRNCYIWRHQTNLTCMIMICVTGQSYRQCSH